MSTTSQIYPLSLHDALPILVQLAWGWVHWQPASALTRWYLARFGTGKRARKVGIVALARKLLIALWRWATAGVLPERSEEHTSELQSHVNLVCRLLLEKKN